MAFRLYRSSPNPFNSSTTLLYDLSEGATVRLRLFDAAGRLVRTLVDTKYQSPGSHRVIWDGRDGRERSVGSGIYLYQLEAGLFRRVGRITLIR